MKTTNILQLTVLAVFGLILVSTPKAQANTIVFDNNDVKGTDVVASTINFNDGTVSLDVSAGASNINLWNNNLNTASPRFVDAKVFQDLDPIHGGLGVHRWGAGTDNFEGTVTDSNGRDWDEVLFFDFDKAITLLNFEFNDNHHDDVTSDYRYSLYSSTDGVNYSTVFLASSLTTDDFLNSPTGGLYGQHFALGAAGYAGSRSYVESLTYSSADPVPEPATLLLFGTGLAGLASLRRRKKG